MINQYLSEMLMEIFVSAADVWNEKKLEELFNRLNPNRSLRLARMKKQAEEKNKNKRTRDICITGFLVSNYF